MKFYSRSRKKVTVLNLFYKGAVNAYFLTDSFSKKTVVFEAAIFVGQSEDGAEVRCEVSRRVETAVSRYSGPSALRFIVFSARRRIQGQIFGAGGAIIQKKNKEKEKGKGKEERREKRKKERGEFNLEDPMFLFNFHSFFQKIIK